MQRLRVMSMDELPAGLVAAVRTVVVDAETVDAVAPLSEHFLLALQAGVRPGLRHHVVMCDCSDGSCSPQVAGYAQEQPGGLDAAAELVVAPAHRRRGAGSRLLAALSPTAQVWAHGPVDAAEPFAARHGYAVTRRLHQMRVRLSSGPSSEPLPAPFVARAFRPGHDEDRWLAANAQAFAAHPEQGRLIRADLDDRMAQPWFDADGLLLVIDPSAAPPDATDPLLDGPVAAFHWTKRHDDDLGEVYAIAVLPAYQGRGLARPVTQWGIDYLRRRGCTQVLLYVEDDNAPALATYRGLGFEVVTTDVMFAATSLPSGSPRSGRLVP